MKQEIIKVLGSIIFIDGIVSMIIGDMKKEKALNILRSIRVGIGLFMMGIKNE